ncbi:MAG: UvrABC system protein C [Firmicutes bacterium ADurb.Bin193]|nr:MAG: UvrABC system protein C [Firmicutes bacterium ADurb.Bin193]
MFKEKIKLLPEKPGVYIMYGEGNEIIYVGKAKNLKNRVTQYFQGGKAHTPKVAAMVSNIVDFDYIITDSEFEALVLECNLIKKHRPKYNILLKDDKGYPYIKITFNEEYPRILLARKIENDGARYFGPYLSTAVFYETIDLAKKTFAIRSCKKVLPRDIGKSRPCLNYHINRCSAPCDNKISKEDYRNIFSDITELLEGNHEGITEKLKQQMIQAAENLEFEKAAKIRDRINAISSVAQKQKIVSTTPGNIDVIALARSGGAVCIQVFFIRSGKMTGRENYIIRQEQDTDDKAVMTDFVKQYYGMASYIPKTILLQTEIEDIPLVEKWLSEKCGASIKIAVPKRGEKRRTVEMAEKNALEALKLDLMNRDIAKRKMDDLMFELKDVMGLKIAPMRIEAYDISNLSGEDSVGVCVVFENGKPKKSDYKKFNIRSVTGPDDYASMKEVLYRRLSNGIEGEKGFVPLPDLILLDGGKGHVIAVSEIMSFLGLDIPFFGMVKDDKHKTRGLTTGSEELDIKRQSAVFSFLTTVQDEVHRFAAESHRKRHKKTAVSSQLEHIKGIGAKRRAILLKHFKTIKAIKSATVEELAAIDGIDAKTARRIFDHFRNEV